jgi:crossover junction endodeoxyribonuclease RuvC
MSVQRVAGVDPGTIRTGIGVIQRDESGRIAMVHAETISVNPKRPLPERLREIYGQLKQVLAVYRPDVLALESVFFSKDFKAAVKIGEARAVAMLAAMDQSIEVAEYMPTRVKEAVSGNGRAAKEQVQFMVKQLLRLKVDVPPDSADALAIALCHMQYASRSSLLSRAAGERAYV